MAIRTAGSVISRALIFLSAALLVMLTGTVCAAGVTYEYDSAGRLRKASFEDGTVVSYTLDAPGNRTTVVTTLPVGPTGVPSFSNITGTTATVSWAAAPGNITGYRYRVNTGANIGAWNSPSPATATSANLSGLTSYTLYTVDVQAGTAGNNWSASSSNSFRTLDVVAPTPPSGLSFEAIGQTSLIMLWSPAMDTGGIGLAKYRLYRAVGQGSFVQVMTINAPNTSATDTGLSPDTEYRYYVTAEDAATPANVSGASNIITGATTPDFQSPTWVAAPSFSAVTGTTATVTWLATDNIGVTRYQYRLNAGGWITPNPQTATSVNLTGLTPRTQYQVDVQAYDAAGNNSTASNSFCAGDCTPPSAPGAPSFSAITGSTATATWSPATDNVGVTGYRYSLNGGLSWMPIGNVLSVNLTGLVSSTSYTMLLQAQDAAGNVGPSSSGGFTTASVVVTDTTTISPGSYISGDPYQGNGQLFEGLWVGLMGSASPSTTSNGKSYNTMADAYAWLIGADMQPYFAYSYSWVSFGGFTSDPGASWLISIGSTSMSGQPYGYNPAYGTATWNMPFGVTVGGWEGSPFTISVTHR